MACVPMAHLSGATPATKRLVPSIYSTIPWPAALAQDGREGQGR
jgi:hypothetical protein